ELHVVEQGHGHARFVEDSVRLALRGTLETYALDDADFLFSRQVNFGTIHDHDVIAERFGTAGELRAELEDGRALSRHSELREWLAGLPAPELRLRRGPRTPPPDVRPVKGERLDPLGVQ